MEPHTGHGFDDCALQFNCNSLAMQWFCEQLLDCRDICQCLGGGSVCRMTGSWTLFKLVLSSLRFESFELIY